MKTIEEIKKYIAKESNEEDFEVLLQSEIDSGYYETAKKLWNKVGERYINQFEERNYFFSNHTILENQI